MRYLSTRALPGAPTRSFSEILLAGLAPDGGLYLPEYYPSIDDAALTRWRELLASQGYPGLAAAVLGEFIDDIDADDVRAITARAYTREKFASDQIVPLTQLGQLWLGGLSYGPTAAFKDMAMQLLGELFGYELARRQDWLTILGATSGDTGSSAEYALRGRPGISVIMLTPAGRMTPFQQAQMFGLPDANIVNVAVDGVFDDCQDLVKAVNLDADFKARWHLGVVNSINWARLMAQVVYYVACYLRVTTSNDQQVSFSVPTGNFGNICAGHIARQMGLPIDRLILATNENNVLEEFFRTGVYRVRGAAETLATSSPSMDISKASNFERFIFDLLGRNGARVGDLFGSELAKTGSFDLSQTPEFADIESRFGFLAGSSCHADRVATIRDCWQRFEVLIDPHTADGVQVGRKLSEKVHTPIVVLETALPIKFAETITEAIGRPPAVPDRFASIEHAERRVVDLPNDVDALKALIAARVIPDR